MTDSPLTQNYRYHRSRGMTAANSLQKARADLEGGKRRYGACNPRVVFNPRLDKVFHGEKHFRWIENAADGLRFVGYADEICRGIGHTGWYADPDGFESYRGVVYQLPARGGVERFAYGYADPRNDGAAFLSFDPCDSKEDAARWADQFAKRCAEEERDYQEAWQKGNRYSDLAGDIAAARTACLALLQEMRPLRRGPATLETPAICDALRDKVESFLEQIREAREEREALARDWDHMPGFADGAGA